ncbi:MAG: hypothetical protein QM642_08425 [Edaphocola sp.]
MHEIWKIANVEKLDNNKTLKLVVFLYFVLLLLASIVWFKQRMLFIDPAWVVFNIVNTGDLLIAEHRYGAAITQCVPLAASGLHLSIKFILISYSISFQLFYLVVVALLLYRYKATWLAMLMAFYFSLMVSDVFFWPNNEVHQGVAFMFLFLGLWWCRTNLSFRYHHLVLLCLFAFLALFSHFLVAVPFSFLWVFILFKTKENKRHLRLWWCYTGALLATFAIKYLLGANSWYDGQKLMGLKSLSVNSVIQSFKSGQARTMMPLLFTRYCLLPVMWIAGFVAAIKKRQYAMAAFTVVYCLGLYSLLCITYPESFDRTTLFYVESEWMGLGILAGVLAVCFIFTRMQPQIATLVLGVVLAVRLFCIAHSFPLFHDRLRQLSYNLLQMERSCTHKAIALQNEGLHKIYLMEWGLPVESLLLSAMEGHEPQKTIKMVQPGEAKNMAADSFYNCFNTIGIRSLNHYYFRVDTQSTYRQIIFGSKP